MVFLLDIGGADLASAHATIDRWRASSEGVYSHLKELSPGARTDVARRFAVGSPHCSSQLQLGFVPAIVRVY